MIIHNTRGYFKRKFYLKCKDNSNVPLICRGHIIMCNVECAMWKYGRTRFSGSTAISSSHIAHCTFHINQTVFYTEKM